MEVISLHETLLLKIFFVFSVFSTSLELFGVLNTELDLLSTSFCYFNRNLGGVFLENIYFGIVVFCFGFPFYTVRLWSKSLEVYKIYFYNDLFSSLRAGLGLISYLFFGFYSSIIFFSIIVFFWVNIASLFYYSTLLWFNPACRFLLFRFNVNFVLQS